MSFQGGKSNSMTSLLGQPESKAREKIGEPAWKSMIDEVENGNIDENRMKTFAFMLGSKIGGNHMRRTKKRECDAVEFKQILADWWTHHLHKLKKEMALEKLSNVFDSGDIGLHPLAATLNKIRAETCEKNNASPDQVIVFRVIRFCA